MLATIRILIVSALLVLINTPDFAQNAPLFHTEHEAAQHCPNDVVVWVNTASGVYHFYGERWYANTKNGAYVCKSEADQSGYRATRNGQ